MYQCECTCTGSSLSLRVFTFVIGLQQLHCILKPTYSIDMLTQKVRKDRQADTLMVFVYICTTGGTMFTPIQFVTVMESCICMHKSCLQYVRLCVHTEQNIARQQHLVRVTEWRMLKRSVVWPLRFSHERGNMKIGETTTEADQI